MSAVETVVAPVVAEPTTPIKPSEALRLGRLLRPRRVEDAYWAGADGACAIGAMSVGLGCQGSSGAEGTQFWPTTEFPCPVDNCPDGEEPGLAFEEVVHLNDEHHWSDDQIVAWLESLGL